MLRLRSEEVAAPRPLDPWALEQIERDHEEAIRINALKGKANDDKEWVRLRRKEYHKKRKARDPSFYAKIVASIKKFRAKKREENPEYDAQRSRAYRIKLEERDPGMLKVMSSEHNKKCKNKHKLDPAWVENKNKINSKSWKRTRAKDPEKYRLEHNEKVRLWNAKKKIEKK